MTAMNPTHFIQASEFITKQWLPSGFSFYQSFPIRIATVVSPSSFWVQLLGPSYSDKLEAVEYKMDRYYQTASPQEVFFENLREVKKDRFAALVVNNRIRRVRVHRLQMIANRVIATVFHVDYGMITREDCNSLMKLRRDFASLPQQAIWATLAGIVPANEKLPWTLDDSTRFAFMVQDKQIEALLVGVYHRRLKMHLVVNDISDPHDFININEQLIDLGIATSGETVNQETATF